MNTDDKIRADLESNDLIWLGTIWDGESIRGTPVLRPLEQDFTRRHVFCLADTNRIINGTYNEFQLSKIAHPKATIWELGQVIDGMIACDVCAMELPLFKHTTLPANSPLRRIFSLWLEALNNEELVACISDKIHCSTLLYRQAGEEDWLPKNYRLAQMLCYIHTGQLFIGNRAILEILGGCDFDFLGGSLSSVISTVRFDQVAASLKNLELEIRRSIL